MFGHTGIPTVEEWVRRYFNFAGDTVTDWPNDGSLPNAMTFPLANCSVCGQIGLSHLRCSACDSQRVLFMTHRGSIIHPSLVSLANGHIESNLYPDGAAITAFHQVLVSGSNLQVFIPLRAIRISFFNHLVGFEEEIEVIEQVIEQL